MSYSQERMVDQDKETEGTEVKDSHRQRIEQHYQEWLKQYENGQITRQELIEKLSDEREDSEQRADRDGLTGLDNRRCFDEEMPRQIMGAVRKNEELSAILLDIDDLKPVNDTYGHKAGDDVLKSVSTTILQSVRLTDLVFRYGGEELVVLLPNTAKNRAAEVAEKLRKAVAELIIKSGDQEIRTTVSVGVDSFNPKIMNLPQRITKDLTTSLMGNLIVGADKAMYAAKQGGKDGIGVIIKNKGEEQALRQVNEQTQQNVILIHK